MGSLKPLLCSGWCTAAVGDSWNDLQLLASADTAAAMENSVDGLCEAAGGHSVSSVAAYIDQLLA